MATHHDLSPEFSVHVVLTTQQTVVLAEGEKMIQEGLSYLLQEPEFLSQSLIVFS